MNASNVPLRIVLIEDSKSDAYLVEEMIKDTGVDHQLTWLSDGEKALQYFEEAGAADFILLDLNLPRFNGHRLMEILKERGILRETPVIILTGSSSPIDRDRAMKNGVVCYLIKPMTIQEMDRMTTVFEEIFLGKRPCNC